MTTTLQEYRKEARRWKRKYLNLKMQGYRHGETVKVDRVDKVDKVAKTEDEKIKIARLYALAEKLGVKIGG